MFKVTYPTNPEIVNMTEVKPITPAEAHTKKISSIPPEVIQVFNDLIVENYSQISKEATVKQDDAVELITQRMNITSDEVFDHGYCDVEEIFRKAGWKVKYDKPAYCESYDAYFVFSKK